ncbi:MAG: helix-turn-helix domain-containing protein [Rhabdochlamydiaceae bacterium]
MGYRKLVGNNIRALRREKGLTQEKLAAMSGIDQGYLGTLERGTVNVSLDTLAKLARSLKVEIEEFLQKPK